MSKRITKISNELSLPRVDGKGKLPIIVTTDDIKHSSKKDPRNCAYAVAAKRKIPGVRAAFFFRTTAWLQFKDKLVRYSLPPSMQKEIVAFDRAKKMEPGTYCLVAPTKTKSIADIHKRYEADKRLAKKAGMKVSKLRANRGHHKRKIKRGVIHATTNIRASGW